MAEILGNNAVVTWTYGTQGTVALTADYRTFSYSPSIDKFDVSCGSENAKSYITGQKDFTAQYAGLYQSSGTPTAGTQSYTTAFALGQTGTVVVQSEGTATGKPKWTFPVFCTDDPVTSLAYGDLIQVAIAWQGNGTYTLAVN
jgi:hypothetical protein